MAGLGKRLSELRERAGLSARELGALAGLNEVHPSMIERDDPERVAARTVAQLATVLGCSMDYLYSGAGDVPSERAVKAAVKKARGNGVCAR